MAVCTSTACPDVPFLQVRRSHAKPPAIEQASFKLLVLPFSSVKGYKNKEASIMSDRNSIDLDTLSLDELNNLKGQQEQQLQGLTQRYAQLRAAAARLTASDRAVLEFLAPEMEGKSIMVPLTSSLYVPGSIVAPQSLLVELGTGFYVEKSPQGCSDFLQRKLKLVDTNSENIMNAIQDVRTNIESIHAAMQGKLLEIRARQEGHRLQNVQE